LIEIKVNILKYYGNSFKLNENRSLEFLIGKFLGNQQNANVKENLNVSPPE